MDFKIVRKALVELERAVAHYDAKSIKLGNRLLDEYEEALDKIREDPTRWEKIGKIVRRRVFKKFPYSLIYAFEANTVKVLAVAHHKRRPGYWRKRLREK